MVSLDLEELDLTPMDYRELQESEGGWFWPFVGAVGVAVVAGVVADWDNFKAGLSGGCSK